jgi:hypothetical protein
MNKIYVIKNTKTKKYVGRETDTTKNISKARVYDQGYIDEIVNSLIEGRVVIQGSMRIGRNHSFKEVKIVEA